MLALLLCLALALAASHALAAGFGADTDEWTVTLDYNDGASRNGTLYVTKGQSVTLPTTAVRKGYVFAGWTGADGSAVPNPYTPDGGLAVLYGNLAPLGAVVKTAGVDPNMLEHSGPARVFNSHQEALNAMIFGDILPGDVIVLRYEGPKGGPGMQEMLMLTALLCGMDMDKDVALVTDGRFSGLSRGGVIGHVSPEAALAGPIALVERGDIVSYSIKNRTITLEVSDEELERRKAVLEIPECPVQSGWLARYAKLVGPVSNGAVLE